MARPLLSVLAMNRTHGLTALLLAASVLPTTTAHAERPRRGATRGVRAELASPRAAHVNHDWSVDLHVGTLAPMAMGGGARVTLARHLIVGGYAGITPRFYADLMQWMAGEANNRELSTMANAMSGAFLFRAEVGVLLAPDAGVEITLNYTCMMASHAVDPALVRAHAGDALDGVELTQAALRMTLHGVGGELAWSFEPGENSFARLSIGVTYFAAAEAEISVPASTPLLAASARAGARHVESVVTANAVVPSVGLSLGWRVR